MPKAGDFPLVLVGVRNPTWSSSDGLFELLSPYLGPGLVIHLLIPQGTKSASNSRSIATGHTAGRALEHRLERNCLTCVPKGLEVRIYRPDPWSSMQILSFVV